jgi:hypothetical protein
MVMHLQYASTEKGIFIAVFSAVAYFTAGSLGFNSSSICGFSEDMLFGGFTWRLAEEALRVGFGIPG